MPTSDEQVGHLRRFGKPLVGIGGQTTETPRFSTAGERPVRRATEQFIQPGHPEIIHIGGYQEKQLGFEVHSNRLRGFREALKQAGLPRDDDFFGDNFDVAGPIGGTQRTGRCD